MPRDNSRKISRYKENTNNPDKKGLRNIKRRGNDAKNKRHHKLPKTQEEIEANKETRKDKRDQKSRDNGADRNVRWKNIRADYRYFEEAVRAREALEQAHLREEEEDQDQETRQPKSS